LQGGFYVPLEEKQKYSPKPRDLQGYGLTFVLSKQKKMDWIDLLGLIMSPSVYGDLNV